MKPRTNNCIGHGAMITATLLLCCTLAAQPQAAGAAPIPPPEPAPVPAFEQMGLPLQRNAPVDSFADARGTILRSTVTVAGRPVVREVYVEDLAYGVHDGQVALARLKGVGADGWPVEIDRTATVTPLDGANDLVGQTLLWRCGNERQELRIEDFAYAAASDGRLSVQRLRGVLADGELVDYQRPAGRDRKCEVQVLDECVSNPADECRWGFGCPDWDGCPCWGLAGDCTHRGGVSCIPVDCWLPNECKYWATTGLCYCEEKKSVCHNVDPSIDPDAGAAVACSLDGGFTVAENGYARVFVLDEEATISLAEYAVDRCEDVTGEGNSKDIYVQIWDAPAFPSLVGADLLDRALDLVPDGTVSELRTVRMGGLTLPAGEYVLEIWNNNSSEHVLFWPGFNAAGQTSPTFWRSESCGQPEWVDLADIGLPGLHLVLCYDASTAAAVPWDDDFDEYPSGSPMHHQGGWKGWDDDPAAGAFVGAGLWLSPPHSLEIAGPSDLVHEFVGAEDSRWQFSAWTYVPGDFVSGCDPDGNCGSYFILMNTYADGGPHEAPHWSVQMDFDSNDGMLKVYHGDGMNTIDVPYLPDAWVKICAKIDLDLDSCTIFYAGEYIVEYSWTGGALGGGGGAVDIAAVDLFANDSTPIYYDDLALRRVGDVNCDGALNGFDIDPFVLALTDPAGYMAQYPECDIDLADVNADGAVNGFDIDPFVALLVGA